MYNKADISKIALREQVGFLGLGACGGNIAYEFEKLGYTALHVNSSLEDLTSLKNIKYYYQLQGGDGGAFKSRQKAKDMLEVSLSDLMQNLDTKLPQPFVVVAFGMGGGTGSGIGPIMCDILANQCGKTVIVCGVLPDEENECPMACNNAISCFAELEQIPNLGATFLLDNKTHKEIDVINKKFVKSLDAFLSIVHSSTQGNLDVGEKKFMLSQSGYAVVLKISPEKTNSTELINAFKSNVYAPRENDRIIRYMGLSLPKSSIDVKELYAEIGHPIGDYFGFGSSETSLLAVGMSFPSTRLKEIQQKVKDELPNIQKSMGANSNPIFSENADLLGGLMGTSSASRTKTQNQTQTQLHQKKGSTAVNSSLMSKYFG